MIARRAAVAAVVLAVLAVLAPSAAVAAPAPVAAAVAPSGGIMAPCRFDDGSMPGGRVRCVWDARHMGNGIGRSFVARIDPCHPRRDPIIRHVSHRVAHWLLRGPR